MQRRFLRETATKLFNKFHAKVMDEAVLIVPNKPTSLERDIYSERHGAAIDTALGELKEHLKGKSKISDETTVELRRRLERFSTEIASVPSMSPHSFDARIQKWQSDNDPFTAIFSAGCFTVCLWRTL